ncbi:MAG TPA: Crp/Fnr family transcriptional regulator [Acidimicrobiales bacterium]|nr:Crp/Fnr family transcriptional regulator [Acidimicrobiales bacterium]
MAKWELLSGLSDDDRRRVLSAAQRRRYGRREVVFHEGDPGDTLHLIDSGRVAVRITTPLGEVATMVVLGPGDVFGELALVGGGGRRTASAVALEKTETLAVHRDEFEELRRKHPSVEGLLVAALSAQVARLSGLLVEALYVPADKRVARRLVDLTAVYEDGSSEGTEITVTQEDLASLAGTSRATANRVVGELEQAGALAVSRGRITVVDDGVLARRAR